MRNFLLPLVAAGLPTVLLGDWTISNFNTPGFAINETLSAGAGTTDTDPGPIVGVANYFGGGDFNYLLNRVSFLDKIAGIDGAAANFDNIDAGNLDWNNATGVRSVATLTYNLNAPLDLFALGDRFSLLHQDSDAVPFLLTLTVSNGSSTASWNNSYSTLIDSIAGDPAVDRQWLFLVPNTGLSSVLNAATSISLRFENTSGGSDNTFDDFRITGNAIVPEAGTTAAAVAMLAGVGIYGYRRTRGKR